VSAGIAYSERGHVASVCTAVLFALISARTIVASPVFSQATVQHLTLASSLAIAGLTILGLTAHEISLEHAVGQSSTPRASTREGSRPPPRTEADCGNGNPTSRPVASPAPRAGGTPARR
jgi:2-methylcitrate dehydratase PrpD